MKQKQQFSYKKNEFENYLCKLAAISLGLGVFIYRTTVYIMVSNGRYWSNHTARRNIYESRNIYYWGESVSHLGHRYHILQQQ